MIISILGAGAFGRALGKILTDNNHEIKYYDPYLYPEVSLEQATYQANAIVIAIMDPKRISGRRRATEYCVKFQCIHRKVQSQSCACRERVIIGTRKECIMHHAQCTTCQHPKKRNPFHLIDKTDFYWIYCVITCQSSASAVLRSLHHDEPRPLPSRERCRG